MAFPTCRELIIDAYQVSGVRGVGEEPSDTDTQMALRLLNYDIIDQLRTDELWPSYVKEYLWQTENGKLEYTIGVPEALPAVQPDIPIIQQIIRIEYAQVQVGNVWTPMRQISNYDYYRQTQPMGANIVPQQFMYNRTQDPYDRFILSLGASGVYNMRIAVGGIVDNYGLDDKIDLPSGYYSTLKYALAELLCLANGLDETGAKMRMKFTECMNRVKEVNAEPPPKLKLATSQGLWSIGVDRVLYASQGL